jgi:fumarate reductase flavoprotein subunit
MRKSIKILLIAIGLALLILTFGAILLAQAVRSMEAELNARLGLTPRALELSMIRDNDYEGSYGKLPVYARVLVRVRDGAIRSIELLEHRHGQGAAGEAVIGRILDEQSLAVDTVGGATYSAKTIVLAVEAALLGQRP